MEEDKVLNEPPVSVEPRGKEKPILIEPTVKVDPEVIDQLMSSMQFTYGRVSDTNITGCWAVLPNGFSVAYGESSCVDPAEYDETKGRQLALQRCMIKARDKLWEFEGYILAKTR